MLEKSDNVLSHVKNQTFFETIGGLEESSLPPSHPSERREGQLRAGGVPVSRLRRRLPVLLALAALRGAARGQLRRGQRLIYELIIFCKN